MNRAVAALLLIGVAWREDSRPAIDSQLASEIGRIRAIDNHAHPVRVTSAGETDNEYDALPVENMEPASDAVRLREQNNPELDAARQQIFGTAQVASAAVRRQQVMREQGDAYPAWVLDRAGIETMLANRVAPGRGIERPRFEWVPYADALLFPLNNAALAAATPDRRAFFEDEDRLLLRYLKECGYASLPATLGEYLERVVTPTLERHRKGGAVAEKFEAAYLRPLDFGKPERGEAERIYAAGAGRGPAGAAAYKPLQDFLFRHIAAECGRLGMAVHLHAMAGAGGYFDVRGTNPLLLEPVLNDPGLRRTTFVLVHGGWPFTSEVTPLLTKPNLYVDISAQSLLLYPSALARTIRTWLEWVPEKVLFGTDAYPYSAAMGWEEAAWIASHTAREALAIALTGMLRDGEITRERALELARMVLRDNARKVYGLR